MNNVLLVIGTFMIIVLAALFAVPAMIDWNMYRNVLEEQTSRFIGREVRVGGSVNLRLLPAPYLRFENVRIADRDGRFGEPLLRAEALTVWLSVAPLLTGTLEASDVELRQPQLQITLDERQRGALRPQTEATQAAQRPERSPSGGSEETGSSGARVGGAMPHLVGAPLNGLILRSVTVIGGDVRIVGVKGREIAHFEHLDGTFSAAATDGPFKFRGVLTHGGLPREFRIGTGKLLADGGLPIETIVRVPEQANTYALRGKIANFLEQPVLDAELTVKPNADRATAGGSKQPPPSDDMVARGNAYEVKAKIKASSSQVALTDISALIDQVGRPQTIVGSASVSYEDTIAFQARLDARWIDLDHLGQLGTSPGSDTPTSKRDGRKTTAGPFVPVARLAAAGQALMPGNATGQVAITIAQANLGGDTVSAIDLVLEKQSDLLQISRLNANLPGSSALNLTAKVTGASLAPTFTGPVQLRSLSVNRLLGWALRGQSFPEVQGDTDLTVRAEMTLDRGQVAAEQIKGELGGAAFRGAVRHRWIDQPDLAISLESSRLDLRDLSDGFPVTLPGVMALFVVPTGDKAGQDKAAPERVVQEQATPERAGDPASFALRPWMATNGDLNAELDIRIGHLLLAEGALHDVLLNARTKGAVVDLRLLKLTGADGLTVEVDGQMMKNGQEPSGTMKALIAAEQPGAVAVLARFLDVTGAAALQARADQLAPMRLAAIATFGASAAKGGTLLVDGAAAGTRVSFNGRLDGALTSWRDADADVTAILSNADGDRLLSQLAPAPARAALSDNRAPRLDGTAAQATQPPVPSTSANSTSANRGRFLFRANGVPSLGLATVLELETKQLDAGISGQVTALPPAGSTVNPEFIGELGLKTSDAGNTLRLIGLSPSIALAGQPLIMHGQISAKRETARPDQETAVSITVAGGSARLGDTKFDFGGLFLSHEQGLTVNVEAKAARVSLPGLLAGLTAAHGDAVIPQAAGSRMVKSGESFWSDDRIDLAANGPLSGSLHVVADELTLTSTLAISRASLDAELTAKTLTMKKISGTALGGTFSAQGRIDAAAVGANVSGSLVLTGAALDQLSAPPPPPNAIAGEANSSRAAPVRPPVSGTASLSLAFSGRGVTPRGLVSVLSGSGMLDLGAIDIDRLGPRSIEATAQAALGTKTEAAQRPSGQSPDGAASVQPLEGLELKSSMTREINRTPLAIKPRQIPVEIVDGFVSIRPAAIAADGGRVSVQAVASLESLRLDSEWTIESDYKPQLSRAPSAAGDPKQTALPGVRVVYSGRLDDLGALQQQINADAFEREIIVRRTEREVEELERLRRLQEQNDSDRVQAAPSLPEPGAGAPWTPVITTPRQRSGAIVPAPPPAPIAILPLSNAAQRQPPKPVPVPAPVPVEPRKSQGAVP